MKRIVSFQFSLVLLTFLLFSSCLYAKEGKIKYGKAIIYEGEVLNKRANGEGTLRVTERYPRTKKGDRLTIQGKFTGTSVYNPTIQFSMLNGDVSILCEFSILGTINIIFEKESDNEAFDIFIEKATLKGNILAKKEDGYSDDIHFLLVKNLVLSFKLENKDWVLNSYTRDFKYDFSIFGSSLSSETGFFYGEITERACSPQFLNKFSDTPVHCYEKFVFQETAISAVSNPLYVFADGTISDGKVFNNFQKGFKFYILTDDWWGEKVLNDGTKVSKTLGTKKCTYNFPDGSKFTGILRGQVIDNIAIPSLNTNVLNNTSTFSFPNGNSFKGTTNGQKPVNTIFFPLNAYAKIDLSSFYDGEYTKDGKTERWIKGESQSGLHQRIVSLYDEDLVAQIESGSISENDAAQTQRYRNGQRNEAKPGTPEGANAHITNQTYVHLITDAGIPHRNYEGKIIVSSFEEIVKLLNNDVVGYYDILAKDKQLYLPRLQKEKKYLMEDEFQREIPYNSGDNSDSDIWWPKYDQSKHCFTFRMWHHDAERYALSNEKGAFHLLVGCREANYCFTYPKSLVSVVNEKHRDGNRIQMQQDQTVYTCTVPDGEATIFSYNKNGSFLWQFKIEKVQANKKRIYGKTIKLQVVSGGRVLADISRTLTEKGNKFNQTDTKEYSVSPPKWHICSWCNGKGWGTGLNDNRRKVCPNCHGKGKVYF